jgi:hypothetical protein
MIKIEQIKYIESLDNFSDVVIQLNWNYSLEGFQSISGTLELPSPSDNFIPIEQLDQDIMIGWVIAMVNPEATQLLPIVESPIIKTITF